MAERKPTKKRAAPRKSSPKRPVRRKRPELPAMVSVAEFGRLIRRSARRVRELGREGVITAPVNGRVPITDVGAYLDHVRNQRPASLADERFKQARAARIERQNEAEAGKSMMVDENLQVVGTLVNTWQSALRAWPARVPQEIREAARGESHRLHVIIALDWMAECAAAAKAQGNEQALAAITKERDELMARHEQMSTWVEYGRLPRPGEPGYDPRPRTPPGPHPDPDVQARIERHSLAEHEADYAALTAAERAEVDAYVRTANLSGRVLMVAKRAAAYAKRDALRSPPDLPPAA